MNERQNTRLKETLENKPKKKDEKLHDTKKKKKSKTPMKICRSWVEKNEKEKKRVVIPPRVCICTTALRRSNQQETTRILHRLAAPIQPRCLGS